MMADWRRDARTPSYMGEPMPGCSEVGHTITPRNVRHEYPGVDGGWVEPLNRGLHAYTLTWTISGPDYMDARDLMEAALSVPAPGTLIHPTRGEMLVCPDAIDISESAGTAVFTVTFVESGRAAPEPAGVASTGSALLTAITDGLTDIGAAFEAAFSADTLPEWAQAETITAVADQVEGIRDVVESSVGGVIQSFDDVVSALDDLEGEVDTLINTPDVLAGRFEAILLQLQDLKVYRLLTESAGIPDPAAGLTETDDAVATNEVSTARLVMRQALAAWSQTVLDTTWTSYDEVGAETAAILARLSAEADYADGEEYQALVDLRLSVAAYLSDQAARLPRLITVPVRQPVSVLTLAWRYHSDPTRCDEVQDRNGIIDGAHVTSDVLILGA